MVGLLLRKLRRDLLRSGTTYAICVFIVALGLCGYSVLSLAMDQLEASRENFFQTTNFPDGFAIVQQAPKEQTERALLALPGVSRAEGRLSASVRLAGAGENAPELKLVSISTQGQALPYLSAGQLPFAITNPGQAGGAREAREMVLGDGFFQAHALQLGDELVLVIQGRREAFTISGSGITPENIYMVKDISDLMPDAAAYDAAFLDYETMARLFGQQGLANEFMLQLEPQTDFAALKPQIEALLEPYGCYSVYARADQPSVATLQSEIEQVGKMATALPALFLLVAAVVLYISLYRLIEQQRTQAGTLMALGLSRRAILLHYLGFGFSCGLIGGILGGILGWVSAGPMVDFYRVYFNLPDYDAPFSFSYLLSGVLVAALFCGLVGLGTARRLSLLLPAEALRPAAPKAARRFLLEAIPHFLALFTVPGVMALRSLARNRKRTLLSITGIAFAFMITATLVSMNTLFDVFLFDYWEDTQKQDISVQFSQPVEARTALNAVREPSLELVEGILQFPVTLRGPGGKLDCLIQAIAEDSQLVLLFDEAGNPVYAPGEGIVLSEHMAGLLGVDVGDSLETEVSYPQKQLTQIPVAAVIAQYLGGTAYMSYAAAAEISLYRNAYTGLLLKAPEETRLALVERLDGATRVALIESRLEKVAKLRGMMGNMNTIMGAMAALGVIVGFAVIYASSLISFEELKREMATMMMLGLSAKQCLDVVSVGQWLLTLIAFLPGALLTMLASNAMSTTMASDLYTIPSFVDGGALVFAMGLTLLSVFFSSRVMLRKMKKLSPVDLLRERE